MLQAPKHSQQPHNELSLKEFLLLFGSGLGCLHSTAGEAPYCLGNFQTHSLKAVQSPTSQDMFVPSLLCAFFV